jgi:hypothetical protein
MKPTIDISNISDQEFIEHMRRLDIESRCPCAGCTKECDQMAQRSECDQYQKWMQRYVLNG